jgi:N-acetylglucosamine kinase-like BadF-type ATPase
MPAALEGYTEAIRGAMGNHRPRELWISGTPERIFEDPGIQVSEPHFVHADELSRGLAAALQTHGIVVLAGTGAFVGALTESSGRVVLDGLGPTLGDYGSGYQIGLMAMRAAMAASWTPERATVLQHLVPRALEVSSLRDVFDLVYVQQISRTRTASAAKAVLKAADDGDAVARRILIRAADDISEVLADVIRSLHLEDSDCALVASGGIAQNSRIYWERISENALRLAPGLRPMQPHVKPCVGAALLALRGMGITWTPDLVARIEETQKPYLAKLDSA